MNAIDLTTLGSDGAPAAPPAAVVGPDTLRGAVGPGEVVAIIHSHPRALIDAFGAIRAIRAVPLFLPPSLPRESTANAAARVGAVGLVDAEGFTSLRDAAENPLVLPTAVDYVACTSGTTGGTPTTYAFSLDRARANALAHLDSLGVSEPSAIVLPMPTGHSFGWVAGVVAAEQSGARLIAFESTPSPTALLRAVAELSADVLYLTPPLARLILRASARRRAKRPDLPGLRSVSVGSAPISFAELRGLARLFPSAGLHSTYGLTELGPRVCTYSLGPVSDADADGESEDDTERVPLGAPLRGVSLRVQDGTLHVRSPYVALGRVSAAGVEGLCDAPHGYLDTRDGVVAGESPGDSREQALWIQGRVDGVIVRGGTNVYPEDVEAVARRVAGVAEAVCVSRPSPMYGAVPVLAYELESGAELAQVQAALEAALAVGLAPTAIPASVVRVPELPRTALGKIARAGILSLVDMHEAASAGDTR